MDQVTELWLSCYLVLLSIDNITRLTRQPQFRDLTHINIPSPIMSSMPQSIKQQVLASSWLIWTHNKLPAVIKKNLPETSQLYMSYLHVLVWIDSDLNLWLLPSYDLNQKFSKIRFSLFHWIIGEIYPLADMPTPVILIQSILWRNPCQAHHRTASLH